jgi:alginate O-acetyltransferase complex protein AlgI
VAGLNTAFIVFALAVAIIFNLSRDPQWRRGILLLASALFLALMAPSPQALIPLVSFIALGFACLRWIQNGRKGFAIILVSILLLFVWLKKYAFLPQSSFLTFPYLTLGLSYILFRLLHLLIEARNGALPEKVGLTLYLDYTLNFTTLVSGPIQRYPEFAGALTSEHPRPDAATLGFAAERIVRGAFKVRVLAFLFASIQRQAIPAALHTHDLLQSGVQGALVFSAYTFFLYLNFSGYIDVVIGLGWLFGIRLPENFDRPFSSAGFIEFWSRWHITLSAWLKDYVYLPLVSTLMRRFPQRSAEPYLGTAAYFVTFFLVGVWHGQTSEFFFFGFLQGAGVALNKLFQVLAAQGMGRKAYREFSANRVWCAFCRGLTFTWFTFTLTWFWSDWKQIGAIYASLGPAGAALAWGGIFAASTILLALWEAVRTATVTDGAWTQAILDSRYSKTAWTTALLMVVLVTSALIDQPVPDIVYGKF